jgi:hypothetical protein
VLKSIKDEASVMARVAVLREVRILLNHCLLLLIITSYIILFCCSAFNAKSSQVGWVLFSHSEIVVYSADKLGVPDNRHAGTVEKEAWNPCFV